ncbi:hypothetical protein DLM45_00245 [Hyphomicrobium methylovorum]|nr:hypothetical protein [Hyphomicrobium methylovorum]
MTVSGASSAESSTWEDSVQSVQSVTPTVGWFLRRSALWAAIVVAAVVSACALYAFANDVGASNTHMGPAQTSQSFKI